MHARDASKSLLAFSIPTPDLSLECLLKMEHAIGSTFMQQSLSSGYPRLLRLFHSFFAKIAVHTDTVYTHNQQSFAPFLIVF